MGAALHSGTFLLLLNMLYVSTIRFPSAPILAAAAAVVSCQPTFRTLAYASIPYQKMIAVVPLFLS